jgi:hypothetical protein
MLTGVYLVPSILQAYILYKAFSTKTRFSKEYSFFAVILTMVLFLLITYFFRYTLKYHDVFIPLIIGLSFSAAVSLCRSLVVLWHEVTLESRMGQSRYLFCHPVRCKYLLVFRVMALPRVPWPPCRSTAFVGETLHWSFPASPHCKARTNTTSPDGRRFAPPPRLRPRFIRYSTARVAVLLNAERVQYQRLWSYGAPFAWRGSMKR